MERAAEQGIDLNTENVSNWFQTGFQDFLAQQERLDYQRARYDAAIDLLKETDTSKLPQAGLQTAAAQIYDLLGHFTPAALGQNLADEPEKYTRIINALSRLAREALALQKYQDACAEARRAMEPMKDPHRKLTDDERRAIVAKVDDILGIKPIYQLVKEYENRKKTESLTRCNEGNGQDSEDRGASGQLSVGSSQSATAR